MPELPPVTTTTLPSSWLLTGSRRFGSRRFGSRRASFDRAGRAWSTRVASGHVVMVRAGALGVLLTLTAIRAASHTDGIVVAARDLTPGAVVSASDLALVRIHAPHAVLASLVRDPRAVVGSVV